MHISIFQNGVANDTKMVWQMIQIWGGKRYKKEVANDTKYGVADDWMADETQPYAYKASQVHLEHLQKRGQLKCFFNAGIMAN